MKPKTLDEIRAELAVKHADNYFDSDDELTEEEINSRNGILHDFRRGFDASTFHHQKIIADLVSALEKIAEYETLGRGNKYKSHVDGWYGVADFARQALAAYKQSETKEQESVK